MTFVFMLETTVYLSIVFPLDSRLEKCLLPRFQLPHVTTSAYSWVISVVTPFILLVAHGKSKNPEDR